MAVTWIDTHSTSTSHNFTGLETGVSYRIHVRGVNAAGIGAEATIDAATTPTWIDAGTATSYTFRGLSETTSYRMHVRGVNAVGAGKFATTTATTLGVTRATITAVPASVHADSNTRIMIVWSRSVTGFSVVDIQATNATLVGFTGGGNTYMVTAHAGADDAGENITLSIAANVVDGGNAAASLTIPITAPAQVTATPTISASPSSIEEGQSTTITVNWDVDVTGFTQSDLTVSTGGTISNFVGNRRRFTATLTALKPRGTVRSITVGVPANVISNGTNVAARSTVVRVNAAPTTPVGSIIAPERVSPGSITTLEIRFTRVVTGLALSKFAVTAGSVGNLQGSGANYTVAYTAPTTSGNVTIGFAQNAVSPTLQGAVSVTIAVGRINNLFYRGQNITALYYKGVRIRKIIHKGVEVDS